MKFPQILTIVLALIMTPPLTDAAPAFDPYGLLLTWRRDPTSTMVIQWLEEGSLLPVASPPGAEVRPYAIPLINDVDVLSLKSRLWREGFHVELLTAIEPDIFQDAGFSGEGRIAWNNAGVILGVLVQTNHFEEAQETRKISNGNSVELICGPFRGDKPLFHIAISPGLDAAFDSPRTRIYSHSGDEGRPVLRAHRTKDGYFLAALIPWELIQSEKPQLGDDLHIQIYLNQGKVPRGKRLAWYPSEFSGVSPRFTHRVSLAEVASAAHRAVFQLERSEGVGTAYAPADLAGKRISVKEGGQVVAEGVLQMQEGAQLAVARLSISLPSPGMRLGMMELFVDGERCSVFEPELTPADFLPLEGVALEYESALRYSSGKRHRVRTTVTPLECMPGFFLHRTELEGLAPDTLYHFGREGREGFRAFRTMPLTTVRPVRIAIGGDTLHRQDWMEESCRVALSYDPDFIIWGGDLADANGTIGLNTRWRQWFSALDRSLQTPSGRAVPVVVAIGNHDVKRGYYDEHEGYEPSDNWRRFLAPEFFELFAFPGQPGYGVLDFGDYMSLLILDSGHTNPIAGAQTQWLEQRLRERASVPHILPVYHVPAFPSVKNYHGPRETEVRKHWPPLFDEFRVQTAFEHHNHAYKRTPPIIAGKVALGGTVYFGDGAWGVNTRPVHDPEKTWYLKKAISTRHVILLTLEGTQQHFEVRGADGRLLDEYSTPKRRLPAIGVKDFP